MTDRVRIVHPGTGQVSEVSRRAFENRSRKLGWVLADGEEQRSDPPDEPAAATGEERERLVEQAKSLGLRVHPRAKTETIRRKIDKALADL
ncbi:MAG TPA: hypothetical protein VKZ89_00635 [Thermobifida alba]|nr:hypothetical protein [Thermobifida alba]